MRMVFEINSLKNATPATVSRAGILFINEAGEATTELPTVQEALRLEPLLWSLNPKKDQTACCLCRGAILDCIEGERIEDSLHV